MAQAFYFLALCAIALGSPASRKCTPCQPGFGMVEPCYAKVDTVCKPCAKGTYSPNHPHHKECMVCSGCGKGSYIERQCTRTSNTFCDSCKTVSGKLTDDFIRSCVFKNKQLTFKQLEEGPLSDWLPMGPGPAVLDDDEPINIDFTDLNVDVDIDPRHQFKEWDGTSYVSHAPVNIYPARDPHYPSSVSAALAQQRRKLWLLIIVAVVVFALTVTLMSLMLYFRCRLQERTLDKAAYLQDHLREQDLLLIQDCAARLQRPSPERKFKEVPQSGVYAFENPLEQLLDEPDTVRT